ncbi:uncharacterized protein LOC132731121 isoform X2 [Ruditapes philippinarum]|uniref:uncharacterized protein LOC132731121 isoform X2 n=1 Tax=Ruditapes philippinarum TaxID=129788 RepID=UPI00295B47C3|nr:uncharacterized protein LOC132731121 isoform X2 [Ruditapes philippinarum]
MYSPFQEVPSTPSMSMYTAVLRHNMCTPEAVVPDIIYDRANSPEQSRSVPGTPLPPALPSSPWTPNARSLTRSRTEKGRRYIYNPSLISCLFRSSPAGSKTLKEQEVPSTPVGGFLLPSTPTHTPRRTVTPKIQFNNPNISTSEVQTPGIDGKVYAIDAAGDRPRKIRKVENKSETSPHTTPKSRPRGERREAVARPRGERREAVARPRGERREAVANFRRSPDAVLNNDGDSSATHDFLDLI